MQARTFFAILGAATVALAFIGWICGWTEAATLWVGRVLILAMASRT